MIDPNAACKNVKVDDGKACTADECTVVKGKPLVTNKESCAARAKCNAAGVCETEDMCPPEKVDDGNACTTDTCDPSGAIWHASIGCPQESPCNPETGKCEAKCHEWYSYSEDSENIPEIPWPNGKGFYKCPLNTKYTCSFNPPNFCPGKSKFFATSINYVGCAQIYANEDMQGICQKYFGENYMLSYGGSDKKLSCSKGVKGENGWTYYGVYQNEDICLSTTDEMILASKPNDNSFLCCYDKPTD